MSERYVWKYPLEPGVNEVVSPGGVLRHVGVDPAGDQDGPCVWLEVDVGAPSTSMWLRAFGTGHEIPPEWTEHVGSVVTPVGLVWHVYRKDAA